MIFPNRICQRLGRRALRRPTPRPASVDAVPRVRLPADHIAAAKALADPGAFRRRDVLNRVDTGADLAGVYPPLAEWALAFKKELRRRNIPFYIFEAVRSRERQNELHRQGRSKARAGQSPHQFGLAVDMISATRYWDLTRREWAVIAAIGKEVARRRGIHVEWGGDWHFYDAAHWQIDGWRAIEDWPDLTEGQIKERLKAARK